MLSGGLVFWEDRVASLLDFGASSGSRCCDSRVKCPSPPSRNRNSSRNCSGCRTCPGSTCRRRCGTKRSAPAPRPSLTIKRRDVRPFMSDRDQTGSSATSPSSTTATSCPRSPARSVFEPDKRRLLLRDPAAERSFAARLEEVGFHRRTDYRQGETLELLARNLPKAVRALLQEGWRVEAEGKLYRAAGRLQDRGDVRHRLVRAARRGRLRRPDASACPSCSPRCAAARRIVAARRRHARHAARGVAQEVRPARRPRRPPKDDHLRFSRAQAGLLDALLAAQPEVARATRRSSRPASSCAASRASQPADAAAGLPRRAARLPARGPRLARLPPRVRLRRLPRRRHGPRQDGPGARPARAPAGRAARRSAGRRWSSCRARWSSTGSQEAARFTPQLRVLDYTGAGRARAPRATFADYDLVLTTYGTLRRDVADARARSSSTTSILDEAQAIKNADSQAAKAARLLRGRHRLALSGTPVENHLGELWSLFEFLNPGMLGAAAAFCKHAGERRAIPATETRGAARPRPAPVHPAPHQGAGRHGAAGEDRADALLRAGARAAQALRRAARPLPRVAARRRIGDAGLGRVEDPGARSAAAPAPGGVPPRPARPDARRRAQRQARRAAAAARARCVDEGHKALVFSQFTSLLAIVRDAARRARASATSTSTAAPATAQAQVERFQNDPDCRLFLISLKAGGLGLNLTAADYVFLLDPWWNPAVEAQAIDRAHRIGQTRPVFAYRLIARDTVEEKILELQQTQARPRRRHHQRRQQPDPRPRPRRPGVAAVVNSAARKSRGDRTTAPPSELGRNRREQGAGSGGNLPLASRCPRQSPRGSSTASRRSGHGRKLPRRAAATRSGSRTGWPGSTGRCRSGS